MKILNTFNLKQQYTNFGEHSEPYRYKYKGNTIDVYLDAGGSLMRTCESDQAGTFSERMDFDEQNNIIENHRYDYAKADKSEYTEYFWNKGQEYTRKTHKEQKGDFIHNIEEYISKTCPKRNYVHETVRDASGNFVKAIMNGKAYYIAK